MLRGLTVLLVFQSLGEIIARMAQGVVPGPVIGMVLLLALLIVRQRAHGVIPESISQAADGLLAHLSIFFIPAAVGVMLYASALRESVLAWTLAIALSTVAALVTTALVLRGLPSRGASPTS